MGKAMMSARVVTDDRPAPDPAARADAPQAGDLVVTREARSAIRYSVRQMPGEPQVSMASKEEALRLARGFARARRVALWYGTDGDLRKLETFRA
jgi:hypothetical protein